MALRFHGRGNASAEGPGFEAITPKRRIDTSATRPAEETVATKGYAGDDPLIVTGFAWYLLPFFILPPGALGVLATIFVVGAIDHAASKRYHTFFKLAGHDVGILGLGAMLGAVLGLALFLLKYGRGTLILDAGGMTWLGAWREKVLSWQEIDTLNMTIETKERFSCPVLAFETMNLPPYKVYIDFPRGARRRIQARLEEHNIPVTHSPMMFLPALASNAIFVSLILATGIF